MKQQWKFFFVVFALFAIAGCDDGGGASKNAFVDGTSEEPGTNPFFMPPAEENPGSGDEGNAPSNPPGTTTTIVGEVEITTNTMKDGLFGDDYSEELHAEGGSGGYEWAIVDGALPDGLALDGKTIQGTPAEVGTFTVTISVTDKNDLAQTDSKSFSFTIEEDLAINVYKVHGNKDHHHRNEPIDVVKAQTVAWSEKLVFAVEGHSENYTWEISDSEKFKIENIEDDRISVEPKDKDADVTAENLSVTVKDDIGSKEKKVTLSSVTFKGNPCKAPLSFTINGTPFNVGEKNIVTTTVGEPLTIALKVSGGVGPYEVETDYDYGFDADGTCHWKPVQDPNCKITGGTDDEDGSTVFTLTFNPRWSPGDQGSGTLSVEDGCNPQRTVEGTFTVDAKPPAEKVTDIKVLLFTGEIHDTGSGTVAYAPDSSWLSVLFFKKNPEVNLTEDDEEDKDYDYEGKIREKAAGEAYYSLAECNDVVKELYSDKKCAAPRKAEKPSSTTPIVNVTDIKDISLLWHDGGDSDVDVDIHLIIFYTNYRYAVYYDEGAANAGGAGNAFDNDVVDHTWRYDDLDASDGMLKGEDGNIWFNRQTPGASLLFDWNLLPSYWTAIALWDSEDKAAELYWGEQNSESGENGKVFPEENGKVW